LTLRMQSLKLMLKATVATASYCFLDFFNRAFHLTVPLSQRAIFGTAHSVNDHKHKPHTQPERQTVRGV